MVVYLFIFLIIVTSFTEEWVSRAAHYGMPDVRLPHMLYLNWCQLWSKLCLKLTVPFGYCGISLGAAGIVPSSRSMCLASHQAWRDPTVLTSPWVPCCYECSPVAWAPWEEWRWAWCQQGGGRSRRQIAFCNFVQHQPKSCHLKSPWMLSLYCAHSLLVRRCTCFLVFTFQRLCRIFCSFNSLFLFFF